MNCSTVYFAPAHSPYLQHRRPLQHPNEDKPGCIQACLRGCLAFQPSIWSAGRPELDVTPWVLSFNWVNLAPAEILGLKSDVPASCRAAGLEMAIKRFFSWWLSYTSQFWLVDCWYVSGVRVVTGRKWFGQKFCRTSLAIWSAGFSSTEYRLSHKEIRWLSEKDSVGCSNIWDICRGKEH